MKAYLIMLHFIDDDGKGYARRFILVPQRNILITTSFRKVCVLNFDDTEDLWSNFHKVDVRDEFVEKCLEGKEKDLDGEEIRIIFRKHQKLIE